MEAAQNAYARGVLDRLPNGDVIRQRVTEIMSARTVSYGGLSHRNGTYYVIKHEPPKQQPFLTVLTSLDNPDQALLVDPNILTGANDPRVDPMQSRKMTARLQAASSSGEPILLRTSANSGHGGDTALSERIEQTVDVYAFLFNELGITSLAK